MAQKGKIKGIKDSIGGIILDKDGNEFEFFQRYTYELGLNIGDVVRYEAARVGGKVIANNVVRATVGVVSAIEKDNCTGYIVERDPKKLSTDGTATEPIPFYQANLSDLGIVVGDLVHYDLIRTKDGILMAINVEEN